MPIFKCRLILTIADEHRISDGLDPGALALEFSIIHAAGLAQGIGGVQYFSRVYEDKVKLV